MLKKIVLVLLLINSAVAMPVKHKTITGAEYSKKLARKLELAKKKAQEKLRLQQAREHKFVTKSWWQKLCCRSRKNPAMALRHDIE